MATRRDFLKTTGVAALGAVGAACSAGNDTEKQAATAAAPGVPGGDSAKLLVKRAEHPQAATVDRLPLEWHQRQVRRLQETMKERGWVQGSVPNLTKEWAQLKI